MCTSTQNTIKLGTFVAINNQPNVIGIVIGHTKMPKVIENPNGGLAIIVTGETVPGIILYLGDNSGHTYVAEHLVTIVNVNYSIEGDSISGYGPIYEEFKVLFDKTNDEITRKVEAYAKASGRLFNQEIAKFKPKEIKKKFLFGGLYATPLITMYVIDKGNKRSLTVNGEELDKASIDSLVAIINAVAAGMHIAPDTIKWGTSIGYTAHIREAINYYFLLSN